MVSVTVARQFSDGAGSGWVFSFRYSDAGGYGNCDHRGFESSWEDDHFAFDI